MTSKQTVASVSGSGFVTGLVTIFVPLTHQIGHLTPGDISTAVWAGVLLCITSLSGYLVHHGFLTVAEAKAGQATIERYLPSIEAKVADLPEVRHAISDLSAASTDFETRVHALEAEVPGSAQVVTDVEGVVEAQLQRIFGEHQIVTTTGTIQVPASAPAAQPAPAGPAAAPGVPA